MGLRVWGLGSRITLEDRVEGSWPRCWVEGLRLNVWLSVWAAYIQGCRDM